ncbi:unnamed protein product [Leptosia nina]|uniref:Uncharacterized protein n=1 Tax=Leptosia nina TaxID=320188 RepID=A0AAV1JZ19_9NEOP
MVHTLHYMNFQLIQLLEWARCGEDFLSAVPTLLWAAGSAAFAHRVVSTIFKRFMFRRIPLWEIILQDSVVLSREEIEGRKVMQQCVIWLCGISPLALFYHTRPRPIAPPLMIWITTSPWQRREMGPYGYYLHRPPSLENPLTTIREQAIALRRAYSDSRTIIKEPPKKRRNSKSV